MKIDHGRLRILREKKRLSRPQLAERAKITVRTIQRLEREPQRTQKSQEHTLNGLAKALNVEPGVLTGESPLPKFDKAPVSDSEKARLAYDLIKRRYGVSRTEIINMAPLFFALLAEGSLARRREKLEEVGELIGRLQEIDYDGRFIDTSGVADIASGEESNSIAKADIFSKSFDTSESNQFASYLHKLANDLDISGIIDVDSGDLCFGSPPKFPNYDIYREELDRIANGSPIARVCLETGYARISEIPEELMAEDASEDRKKWLEDKLPNIIKEIAEKDERNILVEFLAKSSGSDDMKEALEEAESRRNKSQVENEGDDQ